MRFFAAAVLAAMVVAAPIDGTAQGRGDGGKPAQGSEAKGGKGGGQPESKARAQGAGQKAAARPQQEKARGQGGGQGQSKARPGQAGGNERGGGDKARGSERGGGSDKARGPDARGRGGAMPFDLDQRRANQKLVAGALMKRRERGRDYDDLDVRVENGRVRVMDRDGDLYLDMDEERARTLGAWRVQRMDDAKEGSPAFCRSGAGHPVWGREWCVRKGFGLGRENGLIWGRSPVDGVVYRDPRYDRTDMTRDILAGVLGDVVFGRLALHALALGADEPLGGVWLVPQTGPRILHVTAGGIPVADLVDLNRDDEVDVLYVTVPGT